MFIHLVVVVSADNPSRELGQFAPPRSIFRKDHPYHLCRYHGPRGGQEKARRWKDLVFRLLGSLCIGLSDIDALVAFYFSFAT
jgi:hypothetical protein